MQHLAYRYRPRSLTSRTLGRLGRTLITLAARIERARRYRRGLLMLEIARQERRADRARGTAVVTSMRDQRGAVRVYRHAA